MKVAKIESRENKMNRKAMDRPQVSCMILVALDTARLGGIAEIATLRFHKAARGSGMGPVVCNAWINARDQRTGEDFHTRGTGSAGGCGYCKRSAAASDAFQHAGIEFDEYMHGAGMGRVREALEAIAQHFGYSVYHVVEE